jgi:hypothetical protein
MIDAVRETLTSGRLAHLHTTNAPRRFGDVGPWAD